MNNLSIPGWVFRLIIPCCLVTAMVMASDDVVTGGSDDDESKAAENASGNDSGEYFQLENCIRRAAIRNTDIVDDRTIIFYMNQQKIYVNRLPNRCSGLRNARTFAYRTTGSELCNVDTIKVVRSMGRRPDVGPSCGLGMFRPVTKEEVEMIKNKEAEPPSQEPGQTDGEDETG